MEKNLNPRAWSDKVYLAEKGQIWQTHLSCAVNTGNVSGFFLSETVKPLEHRREGTDDPTNKLCREEQAGHCAEWNTGKALVSSKTGSAASC